MAVRLEGVGLIAVDDVTTDIDGEGFILVGGEQTRQLAIGENVRDLATGAFLFWDGSALSAGT